MADRSLQELITKIFPNIIREEEVSTQCCTAERRRPSPGQIYPSLSLSLSLSLSPTHSHTPSHKTQIEEAAFYEKRGIKRKPEYEIKEDSKGKESEKKKGEKGEKKKTIR